MDKINDVGCMCTCTVTCKKSIYNVVCLTSDIWGLKEIIKDFNIMSQPENLVCSIEENMLIVT